MDQVRYWLKGEDIQNFGDYLTEYFMKYLFLETLRNYADVRIVGSFLSDSFVPDHLDAEHVSQLIESKAQKTLIAWGGGIRETGALRAEKKKATDILSVRGPWSASELGLGSEIPMGDPALLLPALYIPSAREKFVGRTVCIPHFHDTRSDKELLSLTGADLILRPNIKPSLDAIERFIDALNSAQFILTASLHGAIVAAAYGRPFAYWNSGNIDLPIKWQDFSESVNIPMVFVNDVAEGLSHYEKDIAPAIKLPSLWESLAAAPFIPRPDSLLKIFVREIGAALNSESDNAINSKLAVFENQFDHFRQIADESLGIVEKFETYATELRRSHFELSERSALLEKKLADSTASAAQADAARAASTAQANTCIGQLRDERSNLLRQLDKAFRSPWRPFNYLLLYLLLKLLAVVARPFSRRAAERFKRSARKRSPRRFRKLLADLTNAPPLFPAESVAIPTTGHDLHPASPVTNPRNLREAFLALHGDTAIYFPAVENPKVSVIIPAYRNLGDLETCLRSLAAHRSTEPSFEVIVIDDCPSEPVNWALPTSGGLIKLSNNENMGFLLTCNRGAKAARGAFLCFLNSDTIVSSGWLTSLVEALEETPDAALSGCMLLNVDGTIQDAGWRILSNGWGYAVGRNADARDGAYTYRRQTDCVTGACFVTRALLFNDMGGLDTLYAPAFYEEFDFAFRARQLGLKAIYEPRSRVVHLGSASYGVERRNELSQINQAKFVSRFGSILGKQPRDTGDPFEMRHDLGAGPVVLVVDYGVPQPDRHAGDVTLSKYLSLLVEARWRVVFAPMNGQAGGPPAEALERIGIELVRAPMTLENWLSKNGRHVQEVLLARPEIAEELIPLVRRFTAAHLSYYTHDLHHLRLQRDAELSGDEARFDKASRMKKQECDIFNAVDCVLSPSKDEADIIASLAPGKDVQILPPYYYDEEDIFARDKTHFETCADVIFVGGFPHIPNVDAALFIVNDVMPIVWAKSPQTRIVLAGYGPPPEVCDLAGERVVVTGQVPSLEPYYDRARVVLAALRYGGGVKGKVVDALRLGVPVVTTMVGAEGIGITPGDEAIVADNAADLAAAVLKLLGDSEQCARLSAAGAALIRRQFSRLTARKAINRIFSTPRCSVCGSGHVLIPQPGCNYREAFVCQNCFSLARMEALGRVILKRFGGNGEQSLREMVDNVAALDVYEIGYVGPIQEVFAKTSHFVRSEYFDDVPCGETGPSGVRCEDVTCLTFADDSFDLVISQDVFEHVPNPEKGFSEVARVLRSGGAHIFTAPQSTHLAKSVTRARIRKGEIEHILPPEYHGDPIRAEGALVFTDFGVDIAAMVGEAGMELLIHDEIVFGDQPERKVRVFEAVKPPSKRYESGA